MTIFSPAGGIVFLLVAVSRTFSAQECILEGIVREYDENEYSKAFSSNKKEDVEKCLTEETGLFGCTVNVSYSSIVRECFCSYYQLGLYQKPEGLCLNHEDKSNKITCQNCQEYSKKEKGPCVRGKLPEKCGHDVLAADIECKCDPGYLGNFCDGKKAYILCHRVDKEDSKIQECNTTNLTSVCYTRVAQDNGNNNLLYECTDILANLQCGKSYLKCNKANNQTLVYVPCSAPVTSDSQVSSSIVWMQVAVFFFMLILTK